MKIFITLCCVLISLWQENVYAFEVNIHEKITKEAIDRNRANLDSYLDNIGLHKGILEEVTGKWVRQWLEEGSKQEDEPLLDFRYLNHFYNPLDGRGLHDGLFTGKSSYEWASFDQSNLWSWAMLRQYYHTGLVHQDPNQRAIFLSKAFRSLGQNLHLVQDNAVPAHVRNDGHPEGDGFEGYTKREDIVDMLNYTPYSFANALSSVSQFAPRQFWDSDTYMGQNPSTNNTQGLSEYTNANFISEDTKFSGFVYPRWADMQYYEEPAGEWGNFYKYRKYYRKIGGGEQIEHFVNAGRLTKYLDTYTVLQTNTLGLDDKVYSDYAQKLIPRAVGCSSGLLNYFFRGKVNMEKDPQNAGKYIIKNESNEKMEGTFVLYYDDASGNRNPVPGASWTLTISPNSTSSPVIFTELTSPAPKEKGKYILVFNGKLGMEEGAVVGREVKLLLCDPSTPMTLLGPESVSKTGTVKFTVSGGCPPYAWTVAGTGAAINQEGIVTLTNSCGSISVTVKDSNGKIASYTSHAPGRWMNTSTTIYGNCCDCTYTFYYPTLSIYYGQSGPCSDMEGNTAGDWYWCMVYSGGFSCYEEVSGGQRNEWQFMTTCSAGSNIWGYPECASKTLADFCADGYNSSSDFGSTACYPRTQLPSVPSSCGRSRPETQGDVVAALLMVQEWRCQ